MSDLVRAIHDALNSTAVPRRPADGLLPVLTPRTTHLLPMPSPPTADLGDVLARRRSSYSFGSRPTLEDLAVLLHHGVSTAPRAGGLPSLVPYVITRGLEGLASGVHLGDIRLAAPRLASVRLGDPTAYLAESLDQPPFATRVPLWLALVADLDASRSRYPPRHYRTLHVDAGAALQNVLLVATARGLPVCPVIGYDDTAWGRLLDLDDHCFVTVLIAVGGPVRGSSAAPP
jgi:SagB-type dehydrogenase family enzyme